MKRIARTTLAATLCLVLGSPALADRAAQLEQLVQDLGSDSFQTRQTAQAEISDPDFLDSVDESELIRLLNREDLVPEARLRLRGVYSRWFAGLERAAMGISFEITDPGEPSMIRQVINNFPCQRLGLVKSYDVFIEVDGVPYQQMQTGFRAQNQAQAFTQLAIISRAQGETLPVTIRRAPPDVLEWLFNQVANEGMTHNALCMAIVNHPKAETVEVEIPLGSYANLGQQRPLAQATIDAAMTYRLQREGYTPRQPKVIFDSTLTEDEWRQFDRQPNRRSHPDVIDAAASIDPTVIAQDQKFMVRQVQDLRRPVAKDAAADTDPGINAPIPIADAQNLTDAETRIIKLQEASRIQVAQIEQRIGQQERILRDRTRTDRERFFAESRIKDLVKQRDTIVDQYKAARRALVDERGVEENNDENN